MMYRSRFKAYTAAMQNKLKEANNSGIFARLLAWVMLGMLLVVGLAVFVVMLLLSWLLIPIMIWRAKHRMADFQRRAQNANASSPYSRKSEHNNGSSYSGGRGEAESGRVFEAEVIDKSE